ncbi:MAG: Cobalamin-binding protein precursor [Euryarchaeota archaeon ADurb.Bin294]|jgi:iron complex transport system substrate-binding protein|nr:MAG: Cobalamin-binding protein precursor [Euryarchaeota archaeon ADurb.Bin294]
MITMMKNSYMYYFAIFVLICGLILPFCSADVLFTDTSGDTITLPSVAKRIICLNSDAAEALVVLGAGNSIIGLTDSTIKDTALMKHMPNAMSVGDWQTPGIERILALKPDAVISYSSSKPKNAEQLKNAGINLIYLDCYKFNTLKHDITSLGTMIGADEKAEQYLTFVKKWEDEVTSRLKKISEQDLPTVYIEGYSDYSAQGKDSGIDILMGIARGKNLAASLGEQWPKVTPEWVMSENPSVIIKTVSLKPDKTLEQVRDEMIARTGFDSLDAVKEKQVFVLNGDLVYGPRSPAGLIYLAKALHPDECKDLSPKDVLQEYADSFVSGTETGEYYAPVL